MTDLPDERTIPVRRGTISGHDDAEATALSARGGIDGGTATEPSDEGDTAPPGPRRSSGPADAAAGLDPDEGSTIVARRESRRRASRAVDAGAIGPGSDDATVVVAADGRRRLPSTVAGDVPAQLGRVARIPAVDAVYPPRAPQPVVTPRVAPPVRPPQQAVDTAAAEHAARRQGRRRAVTILAVSTVIVLVATIAIVILSTL